MLHEVLLECSRVFMSAQYSVSLQSEEEVQEQYQRRPGQAVSVTNHGRHLESCLHTASSHFSLPVPLNVTPGFTTDIGWKTFAYKKVYIMMLWLNYCFFFLVLLKPGFLNLLSKICKGNICSGHVQ